MQRTFTLCCHECRTWPIWVLNITVVVLWKMVSKQQKILANVSKCENTHSWTMIRSKALKCDILYYFLTVKMKSECVTSNCELKTLNHYSWPSSGLYRQSDRKTWQWHWYPTMILYTNRPVTWCLPAETPLTEHATQNSELNTIYTQIWYKRSNL